jgi:hypothetical protein
MEPNQPPRYRRAQPGMPTRISVAAVVGALILAAGPVTGAGAGAAPAEAAFSPVSVTYVSQSEGWALGTGPCGPKRCARLLHTSNDGATWSLVPEPVAGPLGPDSIPGLEVRFADLDDGWIFSTLPSGEQAVRAWSTHDGGQHWSAVAFPVTSANGIGLEDIEASGGVVDAAVQVGDQVDIFSSPVSTNAWRRTGGPYQLGAGPVPFGELALQGSSGWFVENDRVVVSGGRREPSGTWKSWQPPCSRAGGPVILSAPTASQVDAVCTEGVWTGGKISVDLVKSTNGGATFGPQRALPASSVDLAAAIGTATMALGTETGNNTPGVVLDMSFNGGNSWQPVYRNAGGGWLELGFTTIQQGVAIVLGPQGGRNTMLVTRDGGRHWAPVSFG